MSSPYRSTRSPQSSPANRWRRSTQQQSVNGFRPSSSYRESTSSPSRQLAEELSRVYVSDTKAFKLSLDLQDDEQEKLHRQALIKSLAEHEAVRESAERARQRVEIEIERAKQKLAAEERARLEEERFRLEREDKERKAREAAHQQQLEDRRKAHEAQEAQKQEDERRKRQQQQEEDQRQKEKLAQEAQAKQQREKEEQDRKTAERAAQASAPAAPTTRPAPSIQNLVNGSSSSSQPSSEGWKALRAVPALTPQGIVSTADQREAEHRRYMDMHKQLKEMRKWVKTRAEATPGLWNQLSEMRRTIKKKLSMFNAVDKTLNRRPTEDIQEVLMAAAGMTQISIVPGPFVVALDDEPSTDMAYPAALLFLLNNFAKYVIQRFTAQVGRDPKSAEPYGVLLVTIFGSTAFQYRDHSLIDVLWAKYHKVCPVLFGISGNERTVVGKHRLGWRFEKDYESDSGAFVSSEEHLGNQAGLATGFASVTLRDFARSTKKNPAPNYMYWTAMARVLATPPAERTSTHFVVARNMIEQQVPRFIHFFGSAAIAALRKLFREWPAEAQNKKDPNVLALQGLPLFFERDHQLYL